MNKPRLMNVLRERRKAAGGLTQQQLGNLLGRSQAWVTALVAGKYSDIRWSDGEALRRLHAERCHAAPDMAEPHQEAA